MRDFSGVCYLVIVNGYHAICSQLLIIDTHTVIYSEFCDWSRVKSRLNVSNVKYMSIYIARFRETVTPLTRSSLCCPAEMCFQVPSKRSDSTDGSRNESGSEFHKRRTGDWESPGVKKTQMAKSRLSHSHIGLLCLLTLTLHDKVVFVLPNNISDAKLWSLQQTVYARTRICFTCTYTHIHGHYRMNNIQEGTLAVFELPIFILLDTWRDGAAWLTGTC